MEIVLKFPRNTILYYQCRESKAIQGMQKRGPRSALGIIVHSLLVGAATGFRTSFGCRHTAK